MTLSIFAQHQYLNIFQQQDNNNQRVVPPPGTVHDSLVFDPQIDSIEFRADGALGDKVSYVSGIFYSEETPNTVNSIGGINVLAPLAGKLADIFRFPPVEEGEAEGGRLVCPGEKGENLNDEPTFHAFSQLRYQRPVGEGME